MQKELNLMGDIEVIIPSTNEWAAPIVLVQKEDGTKLCRLLGSEQSGTFDPCPMTGVDSITNSLGEAKFSSTLQQTRGY